MPLLSHPYETLIEPWVAWLLAAYVVFCAACIGLDLVGAKGRPRGQVAALVSFVLLLLVARWQFATESAAAVGLVVAAHGVALYGLARWRWPLTDAAAAVLPVWTGLVIVGLALVPKCVALEAWPPYLNSYSALTGYAGLRALEGHWPEQFLRGKEYCLMNGGLSPLMLPLLRVSMALFGGTIFAVRFSEVIASTLLLIVLWLWLRRHLRGGWGLAALAVFAFSPWHLAQSRMGTFFSISATLALALLWIAERVLAGARPRAGWWLALGLGTGLIGYAYAPVKVLYAFSAIVVAVGGWRLWRRGAARWWMSPLLAAGAAALLLAVQIGDASRLGEMFRTDFGTLATDTSIWHKTAADQVTRERQPPAVIAENFFRNAGEWLTMVYGEPDILRWYAPALTLGVLIALVALVRHPTAVVPLYALIGLLPPLIIYPLERRSLIIWPLVYVLGVVVARELARRTADLLAQRWWRRSCHGAVAIGLAVASLQGLHAFAATNSVVRAWPYFGPDHRLAMLREAERLLPACRLVFVNLDDALPPVVEVRLFDRARRLHRVGQWDYLYFDERDEKMVDLPMQEPLCFLYLSDDGTDDVMEALMDLLPGGEIVRRYAADGDQLRYSIYVYDPQRPTP